jgi:hypothetical protein
MNPDYCPNCGAEVPARAKACPECGADETTGWSDRAHGERLGIPDEDFDYERFKREEFGDGGPARSERSWWWQALAVVVVILLLWGLIR